MKKRIEETKKKFQQLNLFDPSKSFLDHLEGLQILVPHNNFLLRKVMLLKMNKMKILTRQFNSEDFSSIYISIKIQSSVLHKIAEDEEYMKPLEVGILDLISFDSLDSFNRPFRMKKVNFQEYQEEREKNKDKLDIFQINQEAAKKDFSFLKVNGGNVKYIVSLIKSIEDFSIYDLKNFLEIKQLEFNQLFVPILKRT